MIKVKKNDDVIKVQHNVGSRRIDDLMALERTRVNEQFNLRAEHSAKLAEVETKRIDALRAVDISAVAITNSLAATQAIVLAKQVEFAAETLRGLVASAATTQAQKLSDLTTSLTERILVLEKAQAEIKGNGTRTRDTYAMIFIGIASLLIVASLIFAAFHK